MLRGAEVRPITTACVSLCQREALQGRRALTPASATRTAPPRSLTHARTTYRPHRSPPTCLRLTYEELVHRPACEVGMVRLFLRGGGGAQNRPLLGGGVLQQYAPPARQHGKLARIAVNHAHQWGTGGPQPCWFGGGWPWVCLRSRARSVHGPCFRRPAGRRAHTSAVLTPPTRC